MKFEYNDGGRIAAGYKGHTRDCVARAIAIALKVQYKTIYKDLSSLTKALAYVDLDIARYVKRRGASPRNGVLPDVTKIYLDSKNWEWNPVNERGRACLTAGVIPSGIVVVKLHRHIAAVIDGVLQDTYDCSRGGVEIIYGYWIERKSCR